MASATSGSLSANEAVNIDEAWALADGSDADMSFSSRPPSTPARRIADQIAEQAPCGRAGARITAHNLGGAVQGARGGGRRLPHQFVGHLRRAIAFGAGVGLR